MQISVTFRHMDSQEALKEYVSDRVNRVKKYLDNPREAQVILSVEKFRYSADVTVTCDGITINGQESSPQDMFSAIDLVMEKIERQAKKHRQKIRERKSPTGIKAEFQAEQEAASEAEEEDQEPRIIKSNNFFFPKPMTVDEAIMQLELVDNNFLVFSNVGTKGINVIYKRKDGRYGLIEPVQ